MIQKLLLSAALLWSSWCAKAQWAVVDTIDQANYKSIHFWDAQNGIVAGETAGKFFKTANSGSSWTTVQAPFLFALSDMQFVDALHGFACGGSGFSFIQNVLVGTVDGGQTWDTLQANAPNIIEFSGVRFKNKDTGLIFSYTSIVKTYDGGHTLTRISRPDTNFYLQDVVLLPDNSIIAAGALFISSNVQRIYRSTNWGASWSMVYTPSAGNIGIASLAIKDGKGIAACSHGTILKTSNNGQSWTATQIAQDTTYFTKAKYGLNGEIYLLAYINTDGYLYGSNDGNVWQSSLVATNEYLVDLSMPTKQIGYVIGYRKVFRTVTGGGMTLAVPLASPVADAIDIYPNPASNLLHINNRSGTEITGIAIYDVTGRLVTKHSADVTTIPAANMQKGMYLLEISSAAGKSTRKIVIE